MTIPQKIKLLFLLRISFFLEFFFIFNVFAQASTSLEAPPQGSNPQIKGWDYVYFLLQEKGIAEEVLLPIFSDARMSEYSPLTFKIKPSESHINYARRNSAQEQQNAFKFYLQYKKEFQTAEKKYSVPASIIAAILQIETQCGKFTGKELIFYKLAYLSSATSPESIEASYRQNLSDDPEIDFDTLLKRAKKLENIFLPQLIATLKLAKLNKVHPLELKGSYAGAIGFPQFLPNNVFLYGVDGNRDGKIDLYNPIDAIHSVGNFLNKHGWKKAKYTKEQKEKLILHYNKSTPYAQTVIAMADALRLKMSKLTKKSTHPAKKKNKKK
ncbi:MAG: lytic murein transglycosylase [Deltaproteobacteria bacterium]|jgi:membrane-bound lytic murein transglycosylase B|nr:lytic murein transglycosylase [Deltaproteobacteria bacterium]